MAKRRKSSGKSSKCPEPINTMIDLAAGLTMGVVASHMEKKYHYSQKGKPNPYAVSALGFATGTIKNQRDILRTGAVLGALGSFDVEADGESVKRPSTQEDPVFQHLRGVAVNNNRYAWRLNCDDGSEYGISPYDYETREEYRAAVMEAKCADCADAVQPDLDCTSAYCANSGEKEFVFLRVSRLDNGVNEYYLAGESKVNVGDIVQIHGTGTVTSGVVLSVEAYSRDNAPQPPEETLTIE